MKKILILITTFVVLAGPIFAQQQGALKDAEGNKLLKGIISREQLTKDTAFIPWYSENLKGYIPYPQAVAALSKNNRSIQFIVFMGTWCHDSQFVIPKFFRLLDVAGFPQDHVTLIAVDENKQTVSHLSEAFNLENVPTIIVMKNGKEIGRVVEYGKHGMVDVDLAEILKTTDQTASLAH
ncbi:MAG TPA: thioredoxin family protein [Chitinophagaceae bacterium]|jgi:thiol-disulfide isomerase/thioredoxin|nr:thioredoxin family protein [Chitinophagaceae bacterium]